VLQINYTGEFGFVKRGINRGVELSRACFGQAPHRSAVGVTPQFIVCGRESCLMGYTKTLYNAPAKQQPMSSIAP